MKNVSPRRMKLGFNIVANGAHVAGWRMPGAKANAAMDIRLWKDMARAAERARIHFMFWADGIAVRHSAKDDDDFGLWDSWEDDAFIRDKQNGRYFDPAKLHTLNHKGEILKVKGPLNVARPIQGYPVIAQAGSSGPGQDLGARVADLIYAQHQTKDQATACY